MLGRLLFQRHGWAVAYPSMHRAWTGKTLAVIIISYHFLTVHPVSHFRL